MKHLDYGYAVTSFSSQGATVEKVIVNVATQDSRIQKLIDQRFAYVSLSRAAMDAQIYTDNADKFSNALSRTQEKVQALHPQEVQGYREVAMHIRQSRRQAQDSAPRQQNSNPGTEKTFREQSIEVAF